MISRSIPERNGGSLGIQVARCWQCWKWMGAALVLRARVAMREFSEVLRTSGFQGMRGRWVLQIAFRQNLQASSVVSSWRWRWIFIVFSVIRTRRSLLSSLARAEESFIIIHYASLIRSIHELLELEWEVEPVHAFREGNNCTDFMAQLGVDLAERHWRFDASPAGLRVLLATDTKRTPFLRV